MASVKRVAKNTAVRTGAELVNIAISTVFLIYVARHLGAVNFGRYAFAFCFAELFIVLVDMGLHTLFIREVAKKRDRAGKLLGDIIVIKSVLLVFAFAALFITINLMNYPAEIKMLVYLMGIFVIGTSLLDLFNSVFRGFELMEYEALVMVVNRLAVVVSGITVLHLGYGLVGFTMAILSANLLTVIPCSILACKGFAMPRFEVDPAFLRGLFKDAVPVGVMLVFVAIYMKADTLLLSAMKGDAAAGLYNAPHRLIEKVIIFPTFFMAAIFPVFSRFHKTSMESLMSAYEGSFKFLLILALPMAVVTTVLSERLVITIFGNGFAASGMALTILIWASVFIFLNILLSHLIIATGRQRLNVMSFGLGALANVVLNLILIPPLSYIGASIALVLSQAILFAFNFSLVSRTISRLPLKRISLKPFLGSLLLGLFVWHAKEANLFLLIPGGFLVYLGALILVKTIRQEDIITAREMVR